MPNSDHRMLYIFGKEANQQLVIRQVDLMKSATAGVQERDIEIVVVNENDPLCKKYQIDHARFTVVLVGKDGGEKYRTKKAITACGTVRHYRCYAHEKTRNESAGSEPVKLYYFFIKITTAPISVSTITTFR